MFISGTGIATGLLRVLPPGGGPAKTLVEGSSTARYLPGGYLLFSRGTTMFAAPMDLDRLELTGPASPLIERVADDHFRGADFDISASGTLVYRRSPSLVNRAVAWLDSNGVRGRVLTGTGAYTSPRLSPDGKRLALALENDIWIYDLAREKMTQLTFGSVGHMLPGLESERRLCGVRVVRARVGQVGRQWICGATAGGARHIRSTVFVFARRQLARLPWK